MSARGVYLIFLLLREAFLEGGVYKREAFISYFRLFWGLYWREAFKRRGVYWRIYGIRQATPHLWSNGVETLGPEGLLIGPDVGYVICIS